MKNRKSDFDGILEDDEPQYDCAEETSQPSNPELITDSPNVSLSLHTNHSIMPLHYHNTVFLQHVDPSDGLRIVLEFEITKCQLYKVDCMLCLQ